MLNLNFKTCVFSIHNKFNCKEAKLNISGKSEQTFIMFGVNSKTFGTSPNWLPSKNKISFYVRLQKKKDNVLIMLQYIKFVTINTRWLT